MQLKEQQSKLLLVFLLKRRELVAQKTHKTALVNGRHLNDDETGGQRLVQLARAGIAVVHRADEARGGIDLYALVARHVNGAAEVERCMQHGQRLIFCHVDLVKHAEAAVLCAEIYRAGAEADLAAFKRIHADETGCVHVDVERYVPRGAGKGLRKILCQHIFACGLAAGKQQVFSAQNGGDRLFPYVLSVIVIPRLRHTVFKRLRRGILRAERLNAVQKIGAEPLLLQKV